MENSVGYADQALKSSPDRTPGNVSALMDQLKATQADLVDRLLSLRERLDGVMRPAEPRPDGDPTDSSPSYMSGLADQLQRRIAAAVDALAVVADVAERLDL